MISRRDPPEVLQATEHALDGVAIAIQERREAVLPFAIGLRRDVEQPEQARKAEGMPSLAAAKSAIGRSSSRRTASPSARQTTSTRRELQLAHRAKHFTGLGPRARIRRATDNALTLRLDPSLEADRSCSSRGENSTRRYEDPIVQPHSWGAQDFRSFARRDAEIGRLKFCCKNENYLALRP